jgi:hypothetical protein
MNGQTACPAPKDTIGNKICRLFDSLNDVKSMSSLICERITILPGENPHDKLDDNLEGRLDAIYNLVCDIKDNLRPVVETLN